LRLRLTSRSSSSDRISVSMSSLGRGDIVEDLRLRRLTTALAGTGVDKAEIEADGREGKMVGGGPVVGVCV
jgi:hypothetical protein